MTKVNGIFGIRPGDGEEDDDVVIDDELDIEEDELDELEESEEEDELDEDEESEEDVEDEDEEESEAEEDEESEEPDESDEFVVTIGDEEPPKEEEAAPEWVKELRKSYRATAKENRELKAKLEAKDTSNKQVQLGPKPKLEDFDFDQDKFEEAYDRWQTDKRTYEKQLEDQKANEEAANKAWQEQLDSYNEKKTKLKVKNFEEKEAVATEILDETQQGIIVSGADDSALVIYALGANERTAKKLAAIKDPVKFAFAVAKLEKDLKVTKRKAPPKPEKKMKGNAPKSGDSDSTLERLRAKAEKTGDYSKVFKYKQQLRNKKKKNVTKQEGYYV